MNKGSPGIPVLPQSLQLSRAVPTLLVSASSSLPQLCPLILVSASSSLLQVILGRPLFLLPWGFHMRACLTMLDVGFLRVWPIHLHLRWRISSSTGSCCVRCQRSSLVMTLGQRIRRIVRRHVFIKAWSFFEMAAVIRHVSAPYNKTGFIVVLNILTLVWRVKLLQFQTFFSCLNAVLALPILILTSASVPPCV